MADEALALETVADRAGVPGRWHQAVLALGVGVAWLAALESISRGSAWWLGLAALLGVAAVAARARIALAPVQIDAGVFHHAGIRMPLAGARVARLAWVGAEGRIGTALEVTSGRRVLRVGVRGATRLSCERATRHVD